MRCLAATRPRAHAAQSAAGSNGGYPTTLACSTQQASPATGRPIGRTRDRAGRNRLPNRTMLDLAVPPLDLPLMSASQRTPDQTTSFG
jgi:hypothetical protein